MAEAGDSPAIDRLLRGAVDLHYHSGPSPFPRRMDVAEAAQHFEAAGFRAIVAKSHHHSTVMDVLAVQRLALAGLRLQVFGSVALNGPVGGLNPRAVDLCLAMGGKMVWFPTMSSGRHLDYHHAHTTSIFPTATVKLMAEEPISIFGSGGDLRPEVHTILQQIKDAGAVLATGHMAPNEVEALVRTARQAGLSRIVLTHPEFIVEMADQQVLEMAELGAMVEHCIVMYGQNAHSAWPVETLVERIRLVGPERTILVSDLGQAASPPAVDWYRQTCAALLDRGIPEGWIRQMIADNPARLLGLDD